MQLGLWDKTAVAILSTSWKFLLPVFLGDTLTAQITVTAARPTSRGDRGIVTFNIDLTNQQAQVVQQGEWVQMFLARETLSTLPERVHQDA